jgi:uncharacterized cupredoxin-like copper-binding protein
MDTSFARAVDLAVGVTACHRRADHPPSGAGLMKAVAPLIVLAALAGASAAARADAGHHHHGHAHLTFSAGEPGNAKKAARSIPIVMREADGRMLFAPDRIEVKRGEQIRFVLTNAGELEHEFVLATPAENLEHAKAMQKNPEMAHDDPNARQLAPKAKGELLWRFTKAGTFEYGCLIPGHREAGMIGTVVVK